MSDTLLLRDARTEDADALSRLAMTSKAHSGYDEKFMIACREELTVTTEAIHDPNTHHVVAIQAGQIIGFYTIEQSTGQTWELEALFVTPDHIGQGIGQPADPERPECRTILSRRRRTTHRHKTFRQH